MGTNNSHFLGEIGELELYNIVSSFKFWFKGGKILRNLYLLKADDTTTEIDLVYISKKGIFVFESKNYSGSIFGNETDDYWKVEYPNITHNFYNPIKQNNGHILNLRNIVGWDIPIYSIIVFSNTCSLNISKIYNSSIFITQRYNLMKTLDYIWKRMGSVVSKKEIKCIYSQLYYTTVVTSDRKREHIRNVQEIQRRNNQDINTDFSDLNPTPIGTLSHVDIGKYEARKICPKCGKGLVLRTAQKGKNAGHQFYGCMGYPHCKYTENIDKYGITSLMKSRKFQKNRYRR